MFTVYVRANKHPVQQAATLTWLRSKPGSGLMDRRKPGFDWLLTVTLWILPTRLDHLNSVQLVNSKYKFSRLKKKKKKQTQNITQNLHHRQDALSMDRRHMSP